MISFEEALHVVLATVKDFGIEPASLLSSTGRILAEDVFADRDFPPYNRVMMDGIAINAAAYCAGSRVFNIEKIQAAGSAQQKLENDHNCIEVMTGAVLPANTDAVIPYEQCEIADGAATVKSTQVLANQHVHLQATDSKKGALLLQKWQSITPAMIGVMASVGLSEVAVLRLPAISICSTGDELVAVSDHPAAHQVRRSNVYMLASALLSEGIHADTHHLPDNVDLMTDQISHLVYNNDVILFSGAVSKGKFDYLPLVLEALGMKQVFHTIAQRPGKPFLFGKFPNGTLIFGFPGNPASTFVCYHQFFKKWLHKCLRFKHQSQFASLSADVNFKPALAYHLLATVENNKGIIVARPLTGSTSGDLVSLAKANAIMTLPAEKACFKEGGVFEVDMVS